MRVDVDEAGRDDLATRVDDITRRSIEETASEIIELYAVNIEKQNADGQPAEKPLIA